MKPRRRICIATTDTAIAARVTDLLASTRRAVYEVVICGPEDCAAVSPTAAPVRNCDLLIRCSPPPVEPGGVAPCQPASPDHGLPSIAISAPATGPAASEDGAGETVLAVADLSAEVLEYVIEAEIAKAELVAERNQLRQRVGDIEGLSNIGHWTRYIVTKEVDWSPEVYRIFGVAPEAFEPTVENFLSLVHPDDVDFVRENVALQEATAGTVSYHHRIVRPDGSIRRLHQRAETLCNDDGEPIRRVGTVQDVTEQEAVAEAVSQSVRRLQLVAENMPVMIAYRDAGHRFEYVNRAFEEAYGLTSEEVVGRTAESFHGEAAMRSLHPHLERVLAGETVTFESEWDFPVAGRLILQMTYVPEIVGGTVCGYYVIGWDITELRKALESSRQSERHLSMVADNIPALIAYRDADDRFAYANQAYLTANDVSREALYGRTAEGIFGTRKRREIEEYITRVKAGETVTYEVDWHRDSGIFISQITYVPEIEDDVVRGYYILGQDITAMRDAVEQQRQVAEQLHLITDSIPSLVGYVDSDLRYRFVNATYSEWHQRSAEEFVGFSMEDVLGSAYFARLEGHLSAVLSGKRVEFLQDNDYADGKHRFVEAAYMPATAEDGTVRGFFVIVHDVTERHLAEERLRAREVEVSSELAVRSSILNALPANIALLDADGVLTWVNQNWQDFPGANGYTGGDAGVGHNYLDIATRATATGDEHATQVVAGLREVLSGRSEHFALEYPCHSPTERRWFRMLATRLGEGRGAVVMHLDISAERDAAERLRHADRDRTLAHLAGGVAHEINNVLTPILALSQLTAQQLPADSSERNHLDAITRAAERASEIVKGVLTFTGKTEIGVFPVPVEEIIHDSLVLARGSLPGHIDMVEDIGDSEHIVDADPTQIQQVLLNVVTNATKAIGDEAGIITISVESRQLREEVAIAGSVLGPGDYAVIRVADTGPGMDADTIAHIFDPFFTTREVGEGTGLGLSIVHGIMEAHQGGIHVESEPGQGAVFEIYLPAAAAVVEEAMLQHAAAGNASRVSSAL